MDLRLANCEDMLHAWMCQQEVSGEDDLKGHSLILGFYLFAQSKSFIFQFAISLLKVQEKKRHCKQRVLEVEHGTFTPLVLSAFGIMVQIATAFYSHLTSMI